MSIYLVVVEDHPLMLKAVLDELRDTPDFKVVEIADHGSKLIALV